jgi:hypothetical protein
MHPIYTFPLYIRSILILSSHLRLSFSSGLFTSSFPTNILYTFYISPMHVTCPTYLILLDFITLVTSSEAYKLWSSSSCSVAHPASCHLLLRMAKFLLGILLVLDNPTASRAIFPRSNGVTEHVNQRQVGYQAKQQLCTNCYHKL